jgi:DNA recombination protein RmuC
MITNVLLALSIAGIAGVLFLLMRLERRKPEAAIEALQARLDQALRDEQREGRNELRTQIEALTTRLHDDARKGRTESAEAQHRFAETLGRQLAELTQRNELRIADMRATLESQLQKLQADNAQKLDQMRATVDEKLHATLETRLSESFGNVATMLAQVHQGLGDMNKLASDVGGLQRVLTNVKTRGVFGEVQLAALLEQVFAPDQYAANVATRPGSAERVEFAVRFPGSSGDAPVWLPIDAKFPREDYERLLDAQERGDTAAAHTAGDALERRVRLEAARICEKYIVAPHTTEFAILFLPTEGLYAEVLRRPGLVESLQRESRIAIAGPTTLLALMTSFQMGFRTLAIQERSSEVWRTLGAVKFEFGKFGDVLEAVQKKLDEASRKIEETGRRTRVLTKKLRDVEVLPAEESRLLLGAEQAVDED